MNASGLRWLFIVSMALPAAVQAFPVYRCTGGPYVAYQNYPCQAGLQETMIMPSNSPPVMELPAPGSPASEPRTSRVERRGPAESRTAPAQNPAATNSASGIARRPALTQTVLRLGMTDDQVLNLPRWGLPDKITRTRLNHVWHEEWLYLSRDGAKRLSFDNAKLTSIDTDPGLTSRQYAGVSLPSDEARAIQ